MTLADLHGIGPSTIKRLKVLDVTTVTDLLWHLPRDYEDRSVIETVSDLSLEQNKTVCVIIDSIRLVRTRQRLNLVNAGVHDDSGQVGVTWFNQPYLVDALPVGTTVYLHGKLRQGKTGVATLSSPEYEKQFDKKPLTHSGRIIPLYDLTAGITQKQLRHFTRQAIASGLPLPDYLPTPIIDQFSLCDLTTAVAQIHFPDSRLQLDTARHRLAFDQLYLCHLQSLLLRQRYEQETAPVLAFYEEAVQACVAALPFTLTDDQKKAAWQALRDTAKPHPMNRLLVGDVGSGKTVTAALVMLNCVRNGYQAALMAPTEILAEQHYRTLQNILSQPDIHIGLLTAHHTSLDGQDESSDVVQTADIIVGTHALIQSKILFDRLGLVVVDEQHRFGVRQRHALKMQSGTGVLPHLLSMTATPIPRTLGLALYGDLDLSIIAEMPKGRLPVITRVVPPRGRTKAYQFVRGLLQQGQQCFVICPLIEPSDTLGIKSVTEEFDRLQSGEFAGYRIGMLHGKLSPDDKTAVLHDFQNGTLDVIVATSVVEVGVDIPGATVMLIEGAERFGLAQLHQFRGRVGRSDQQSYCLIFAAGQGQAGQQRLAALANETSGFALAEIDLQQRGAGDVYGTAQSGFSDVLRLALHQPEVVEIAHQAAAETIAAGLHNSTPALQAKLAALQADIHLE